MNDECVPKESKNLFHSKKVHHYLENFKELLQNKKPQMKNFMWYSPLLNNGAFLGKYTKRTYDGDDVNNLEKKAATFCYAQEVRKQCDGGPCKLLRKKKIFNNPMKRKYRRFEPKKLRHYQVQYIIQKKYLPIGKQWVLSHRCHNKLCVNVNHIECERDFKNSSRNGCKAQLSKIKKGKNQILRCTKHDPCCFM